MLLAVTPCIFAPGDTQIHFVVPGHQSWSPLSFRGTASRDTGGAPDRSYSLVVTDGTNVVALVGADDNGSEPGLCDITWCDAPAATVAAGNRGVTVAPLPAMRLPAGYTVSLVINNAVGVDAWVDAVAWYDYVLDTPPGIQ